MRRGAIASVAIAAVLALLVISNLTYRKRRQERAILTDRLEEYAADVANSRYVDFGVLLHTVVSDPNGTALIPGKQALLRVVRSRLLGGILDTKSHPPRIIARSRNPRVWFCSEDQEPGVLHSDEEPRGQLVYGSEGAGKTTMLAMWHFCRVLEHIGEKREGGQTAPTKSRLKMVRDEMLSLYPREWYRHLKSQDVIRFRDGTRIQLKATKQQSAASGSPIQGFNWSWCGRDEGQDQIDRHEDIQARGRAARDGGSYYKQCITATAKDASEWRAFREMLIASGQWLRRTLLGLRSPFIGAEYWEGLKATMSKREYRRRVLAEDVGVELAVYYGWDREMNLRTMPPGALDVTAAILAPYQSYTQAGARFALVAGHDPGVIFNTTVLKRLAIINSVPTWVVVGEWQSKQTTPGQHARDLKKYIQETFGYELGPGTSKVAIFCDPHGKGEQQTDYQTHYMAFQREGLDIFSPAPMSGRIKRSARVGMINRLLGGNASDGHVRLVIATDRQGKPVAPHLVRALETLEKREGDDNPEGGRHKDESDQTHAPAAASYALWPFEQEAFTTATVALAMSEARRLR